MKIIKTFSKTRKGADEINDITNDLHIEHFVRLTCPHCKKEISVRTAGFNDGWRISECTECEKNILISYEVEFITSLKMDIKKIKIG